MHIERLGNIIIKLARNDVDILVKEIAIEESKRQSKPSS